MFAVEMQNITKTFGESVVANRSVNFNVIKGEIHALVGENGAGKTTLMNVLYGMYNADKGSILINGKEEIIDSPARAILLHIGMVHQHFMLVNPLTVLENIILGNEITIFPGRIDIHTSRKRINELMMSYNIRIDIDSKISELSVGAQQRVEILKILFRDADILILDEPTAVLTPQETDDLFNTLRFLKEKGKTIILITHKLDEVMGISDNITVMRKGSIVGELLTSNTNREEIAQLMIGKDFEQQVEKGKVDKNDVILNIDNITVLNDKRLEAVKEVSLKIYSGEILGIAGIEGNGQNELAEAVTCLRQPAKGTISIEGKEISRADAIAHIPSDRQRNGMVMDFSLSENMILGRENEDEFSNPFMLKEHRIEEYANSIINKYDVRITNKNRKIKELSGGNQQKAIVGRELSKNSKLIVASHPTRGLDIKATGFVHNIL